MMSDGDVELSTCKRQKVAQNEQIDWISGLPDPILVHILSLLPTEDAVKTVLIRRFGSLWTYIQNLDFDVCLYHVCNDIDYGDTEVEDRLINLIRHVLILHQGSDMHKFSLKLVLEVLSNNELDLELADEIDTWIRFALRKKVKVLELDFKACTSLVEGYHKLSSVILISDFLTELKLVCCHWEPRVHIQLWSLKSLSLECTLISCKTMNEILSGCPVLESLFLYRCCGFHKLDFTSRNLKNVVIELDRDDSSRLQVSCPYVTSLNISGIERTDLYNMSSIVDAVLDVENGFFKCARGEHRKVKMLFEQLREAELFTLLNRAILVFTIWELIRSSCPSMNWRHLHLKMMMTKWHLPGVASLLRNCPDLEMLDIHIQRFTNPFTVIDDPWLKEYEIDGENFWDIQRSSFHCLRSHLKIIRIRGFRIESCAVKLVHFLLRKASVLEKLVIETNRVVYPHEENKFTSEKWKEFSEDIHSCPRASPQAVILIR